MSSRVKALKNLDSAKISIYSNMITCLIIVYTIYI